MLSSRQTLRWRRAGRWRCLLWILLICFLTAFLSPYGETSSSTPTFQLFIAPKPGFESSVPHSIRAWEKKLRNIDGEVIILLNEPGDILIARNAGFRTERVQESENGFPLLDSLLRVISKYRTSQLVGFCNSDILPGELFSERVQSLAKLDTLGWHQRTVDVNLQLLVSDTKLQSNAWMIILSRYDFTDTPRDAHVFKDGGVDMWIWNNVAGINDFIGTGAGIPPFRLGRPWFDNWLTATAMQLDGRQVIDGTNYLRIDHKIHKRLGGLRDWSNISVLESDLEWTLNKQYSRTQICHVDGKCSMYRLGIGTTCEAPFYLTGSELDQSKSFEVVERDRLIPCPSCQDCYL